MARLLSVIRLRYDKESRKGFHPFEPQTKLNLSIKLSLRLLSLV